MLLSNFISVMPHEIWGLTVPSKINKLLIRIRLTDLLYSAVNQFIKQKPFSDNSRSEIIAPNKPVIDTFVISHHIANNNKSMICYKIQNIQFSIL